MRRPASAIFEGVTGKRPGGAEGLIYSRFNGPNQEILEDRLCGLGGCARRLLPFSLGDVGDRDRAAHACPAGRRDRPFRPALCGDRDADRQDPRPLRRDMARFPGRRDARGDRRGARPRQVDGPRARSSISKARPTRPTCWSMSRRSRPPATRSFRRAEAADRDRQHIPRAALGEAARPWRRSVDLSPDQICRRPFSDLVAGGVVGEQGADQSDPHDAQHDRHDLAIRTPPGCCCAASRRWSCA